MPSRDLWLDLEDFWEDLEEDEQLFISRALPTVPVELTLQPQEIFSALLGLMGEDCSPTIIQRRWNNGSGPLWGKVPETPPMQAPRSPKTVAPALLRSRASERHKPCNEKAA